LFKSVKLNKKTGETSLPSSLQGNGIAVAPIHYGVVYHVCRQVSARVTYRSEDQLMR